MKKIIFTLVILVIAFSIYWFKFRTVESFEGEKAVSLKASIHSGIFNNSIDTMMSAYFNLKAAFVEADTLMAKTAAKKFLVLADSVKLDELKEAKISLNEKTATITFGTKYSIIVNTVDVYSEALFGTDASPGSKER